MWKEEMCHFLWRVINEKGILILSFFKQNLSWIFSGDLPFFVSFSLFLSLPLSLPFSLSPFLYLFLFLKDCLIPLEQTAHSPFSAMR